jgi:ATP-binding cassette subfamily B protein
MSVQPDRDYIDDDARRRPPRAVVGSHRPEEEMFGRAFDGRVVRRVWRFVRPYRVKMAIAVVA